MASEVAMTGDSEWNADKAAHCFYGMSPDMYD